MKTCPVCHARAFDDAGVCFGCLHRFDGEARAAPAPLPVLQTRPPEAQSRAGEKDRAEGQSPAAAIRAASPPQPAPCPFPGGRAAPPRAAKAVDGEVGDAVRLLDAPPPDGGGWVVRFEFPGLAPAEGMAAALARQCRVEGAGSEGLVVSLRPGSPAAAPAAAARGVHARAGGRPLPGLAAEGS